jgi:uncharacterized coiled-coil protein SlyX
MASEAGKLFQKKLVYLQLVTAVNTVEQCIDALKNNDAEQADVVPGLNASLASLTGTVSVLAEKLRGHEITLLGGNPDVTPQT